MTAIAGRTLGEERARALRLRPTPVVVAGRPGTTLTGTSGLEVRWDLALAADGPSLGGVLPVQWTDGGLRWRAFAPVERERAEGITLGPLVGTRTLGAPVREPWRTLRLTARDGRLASAVYRVAHADETWLEVDVDPDDELRPDVVWAGELACGSARLSVVARAGRRRALPESEPRTRLTLRWWPKPLPPHVFGASAGEGGFFRP